MTLAERKLAGRRWIVALVCAAAVALAGLGTGKWVAHYFAKGTGTAPGGDAIFAVTLPDLGGTPQPLRQWQGKVLVVNFWATWCVPCRDEMPALVAAQARYAPKGLQIVGIGIDDVAKMRQFTESIHLNYPALDGGYGALELSKTLGNSLMALPFTVVVDRQGHVAQRHLGPLTQADLDVITTQLL